jgi:hypothetical protein
MEVDAANSWPLRSEHFNMTSTLPSQIDLALASRG